MRKLHVRTPTSDKELIQIPEDYADLTGSPPTPPGGVSYDQLVFSGFSMDGSSTGRFLVPGYAQVVAQDMFVPIMKAGIITLMTLKYCRVVPTGVNPALMDFTMRKNGVDTLFTIPVTDADSATLLQRDSIYVGPVSVGVGDLISVKEAHNGSWLSFHNDFVIAIKIEHT